jgi:hypothetical protein
MEVNQWAFRIIKIEKGKVDCPWWKTKLSVWDEDKGCLLGCEFCNGTAQGEGIECLYEEETKSQKALIESLKG